MGYTDEEKERVEHQFDAYNKKIMRRKAAKCYAVLNQKQLREVPFDSLAGEEEEQMAVSDSYEGLGYPFEAAGVSIIVQDERLIRAFEQMQPEKRSLLLLYYYLDMRDRVIAEQLQMIRRTVTYQRMAALSCLKAILEELDEEK